MIKRIFGYAIVVGVAVVAVWGGMRWFGGPGAVAQAQGQGRRGIPVTVLTAVKKKVPVKLEALGSVMPMASVAVRSRLDSEIVAIEFADGAMVKQGDILLHLDTRTLEAAIQAAEGNVARDQAQL